MTRETPSAPCVRVVVCAGTAERRRSLHRALDDARLVVVGEAREAADVEPLLGRLAPTVLVLDSDLPPGTAALLERVMAHSPLPVVLCHDGRLPGVPAAALAAGAVDAVLLPAGRPGPADVARLCAAVALAARARVITHPRGHLTPPPLPTSQAADPGPVQAVDLVVVGASTGGPAALGTLLARLPADFGAAVVLVQHMGSGFVPGLAAWLDVRCALPVAVAVDGLRLAPGTVTVAPGDLNLLLAADLGVRLVEPPGTQFHRPGVDATLLSAAAVAGPRTLGVVLTGMGRDGAAGLLAVHRAGGRTLAQAEAGCTVYGMPAAAVEAGGVDAQLEMDALADRVVALAARPALVAGAGR